MGGHRDDLEFALDKPVVSLSMGLPGLFLLGGNTKEDGPVLPILVRPGDVMILGGSCRLAYHGMARVIPPTVSIPPAPAVNHEQALIENSSSSPTGVAATFDEVERPYLAEYLQRHRININVRQVLPDGVSSIAELKDRSASNEQSA